MSRGIKFRAWDKQNKEWCRHTSSVRLEVDNSRVYHMHEDGSYNGDCGHLEITQFTGLLDKNGSEIYEGDTVEYEARLAGESEPASVRQTVHYEPALAAWCLTGSDAGSCLLHSVGADILTVVGNVYER